MPLCCDITGRSRGQRVMPLQTSDEIFLCWKKQILGQGCTKAKNFQLLVTRVPLDPARGSPPTLAHHVTLKFWPWIRQSAIFDVTRKGRMTMFGTNLSLFCVCVDVKSGQWPWPVLSRLQSSSLPSYLFAGACYRHYADVILSYTYVRRAISRAHSVGQWAEYTCKVSKLANLR